MKFKTLNIFKNKKTKWSVDFGVCALMSLNVNDNYTSSTCHGCYSARILNVYPSLRAKLEKISGKFPNMSDFKDDIKKIRDKGNRFIRFYSLGDFASPKEIDFIHAAADILRVEAFSKTLHQFHRKHLPLAASHPDVNFSLSFNQSYTTEYREKFWEFLKENNLLKNCQLNYTFMADEPMELKSWVSVYHTTKKNKLELFQKFGYNRVCCARDESGERITDKNSGNTSGSCNKCPLCRLPAANKEGQILVPSLMKQEYINI